MKTENQKAWFFVLPVLLLVAFNALVPIMTVVNYSVQETFGNNVFFWQGGSTMSRTERERTSGVATGAGQYAPIPPVLGPRSPS